MRTRVERVNHHFHFFYCKLSRALVDFHALLLNLNVLENYLNHELQQYLTGRWCQLCTHITGSFCFVLTWIQFKELCHGWQVICLSQDNPKQSLFLFVWYYLFNVFLLVMVNFHVEVSIISKVALSITKIV